MTGRRAEFFALWGQAANEMLGVEQLIDELLADRPEIAGQLKAQNGKVSEALMAMHRLAAKQDAGQAPPPSPGSNDLAELLKGG